MGPLRILVIDDEPTLLGSCRRILECAGHRVQTAETASSALELCRGQSFDVVLLDIPLSDMSGLDLVERLKEVAPLIRIVVMTGYGSREMVVEAVRRGARGFQLKPFLATELRQVVASGATSKSSY